MIQLIAQVLNRVQYRKKFWILITFPPAVIKIICQSRKKNVRRATELIKRRLDSEYLRTLIRKKAKNSCFFGLYLSLSTPPMTYVIKPSTTGLPHCGSIEC